MAKDPYGSSLVIESLYQGLQSLRKYTVGTELSDLRAAADHLAECITADQSLSDRIVFRAARVNLLTLIIERQAAAADASDPPSSETTFRYFGTLNEAEAFVQGIQFLTDGDYATVLEKVRIFPPVSVARDRQWKVQIMVEDS